MHTKLTTNVLIYSLVCLAGFLLLFDSAFAASGKWTRLHFGKGVAKNPELENFRNNMAQYVETDSIDAIEKHLKSDPLLMPECLSLAIENRKYTVVSAIFNLFNSVQTIRDKLVRKYHTLLANIPFGSMDPLRMAVEADDPKMVELLISNGAGLLHESVDRDPTLFVPVINENLAILKLLIEKLGNIGVKNAAGNTILHFACTVGNTEILKYIISESKDSLIEVKNDEGNTPLFIACIYGNKKIIAALIDAGANIRVLNDQEQSILFPLCRLQGARKLIQLFVDKGLSLDITDDQRQTLLHIACQGSDLETINLLFNHNPEAINAKTKEGETPLHMACETGNVEAVSFLFENGADINARNDDGNTCLELAISKNQVDVVKWFLVLSKQIGLKLDLEGEQGELALLHALQHGHWSMASLWIKHGVDFMAVKDDWFSEPEDVNIGIFLDNYELFERLNELEQEYIIDTINYMEVLDLDTNVQILTRNLAILFKLHFSKGLLVPLKSIYPQCSASYLVFMFEEAEKFAKDPVKYTKSKLETALEKESKYITKIDRIMGLLKKDDVRSYSKVRNELSIMAFDLKDKYEESVEIALVVFFETIFKKTNLVALGQILAQTPWEILYEFKSTLVGKLGYNLNKVQQLLWYKENGYEWAVDAILKGVYIKPSIGIE